MVGAMPRPLTKGKTIPVQLPLAVDRQVRELAEREGCSPGVLIGQWAEARLRRLSQLDNPVEAQTIDHRGDPPGRINRFRHGIEGASRAFEHLGDATTPAADRVPLIQMACGCGHTVTLTLGDEVTCRCGARYRHVRLGDGRGEVQVERPIRHVCECGFEWMIWPNDTVECRCSRTHRQTGSGIMTMPPGVPFPTPGRNP
jgi:hypothetical protein